jgi:hypothetical protein
VAPVDLVFDTAGGDRLRRSLAVLRAGGRLVSVAEDWQGMVCASELPTGLQRCRCRIGIRGDRSWGYGCTSDASMRWPVTQRLLSSSSAAIALPSAIVLTVMPRGPSSWARWRVNTSIAPSPRRAPSARACRSGSGRSRRSSSAPHRSCIHRSTADAVALSRFAFAIDKASGRRSLRTCRDGPRTPTTTSTPRSRR